MKNINQMYELLQKTQEYLNYIEEHYNNVQKAWEILKEKCKHSPFIYDDFNYFTIDELIKNHDLSKLSNEEFIPYRKQFFPTSFEKLADNKEAFDLAWRHHKENNPHHWEHWIEKHNTVMPDNYDGRAQFICMVCDWMAMSMKFGDTPREYYEKNKNKIQLSEDFIQWLYAIFEKIDDNQYTCDRCGGKGYISDK